MMQKCERIGIPCLGSVVYEIDGREARVCYDNLNARLQLIMSGKIVLDMLFPLNEWDEVRELGAYWIIKASKPTTKDAA